MKTKAQIEEIVKNMSNSELLCMINAFCEEFDYYEKQIYEMELIDEYFKKPSDILGPWFNGYRFNPFHSDVREENTPNADYFTFNGYGNIQTVEDWALSYYLLDLIEFHEEWAEEYIIENELEAA